MDKIFPEWYNEYRSLINDKLRELYSSLDNHPLSLAVRYAIMRSGKRFRPILTLLACEAVNGERRKAIPVSLAYELIHTSSLIIDDMFDDADKRRGDLTVHKKWNRKIATLASGILLNDTYGLLKFYKEDTLSKNQLYELIECFVESVYKTVLGASLELERSELEKFSVEKYLEIVELKTCPLISLAAKAGAIVGGGRREEIEALHAYGKSIGYAWQIRDDLLDIYGTQDKIGKPVLNDLKEEDMNIVIIKLFAHLNNKEKDFLLGLWGKKDIERNEIEKIHELIEKYSVKEEISLLQNRYKDFAMEDLNFIEDSPAKEKLAELLEFVTTREL